MAVLRRVVIVLFSVHVVLGLWSGYRAIVQVFRLDLRVPQPVLRAGSSVGYDVVSSGRVPVRVRLELIQGTIAETLAVMRVRDGTIAGYDPRIQKGAQTVRLSDGQLARFSAGPAVVRATAIGSSQWLRTPPPTVREAPVLIGR